MQFLALSETILVIFSRSFVRSPSSRPTATRTLLPLLLRSTTAVVSHFVELGCAVLPTAKTRCMYECIFTDVCRIVWYLVTFFALLVYGWYVTASCTWHIYVPRACLRHTMISGRKYSVHVHRGMTYIYIYARCHSSFSAKSDEDVPWLLVVLSAVCLSSLGN